MVPDSVRVRTFHALGREILRDAGVAVEPLADRDAVLRELFPGITRADRGRLDLAFSRLKLDLRVRADEVARDPLPGPIARAFIAYEGAIRESGGARLRRSAGAGARAPGRGPSPARALAVAYRELLVDEAQDLDRTQLALALLLGAPANDVFLVGDDDQTVYSWRLADVRRVLGLAAVLPGLRRLDLETNYRCPPPVVARAVRLVEHNRERFAKRILAGSRSGGRLILAPDAADDVVRVRRAMASWPADDTTRAVLARTNRELLVAVVSALDLEIPFRAPDLALTLEDPRLDGLLDRAESAAETETDAARVADRGPLPALGRLRSALRTEEASSPPDDADEPTESDLATALLGWAATHPSIAALRAAVAERRSRLTALRRDDAALTLATAHGTKGLEWDHVLVLADGFPGRRAVSDATEPERALEEERRLAYVAWTRARRSLTLLYDPEAPSPFLCEAFDPAELAPPIRERAA